LIDLHSHVLHGLDDGAADLAEAVEICRAASADGITILAATPHVRDDYPTTPDQMEARLAEVRSAAGDLVALVPGGELDLAHLERDDVRRFALGGGGYLLVETPYVGWPPDIADRLLRLRVAGIGVVLAHPERNAHVQANPQLLAELVGFGVLVQLTAASVEGRLGERPKKTAHALLGLGLAHLIASDAHAPSIRAIGMAAAAKTLDPELARWLTLHVPRAVLDGETLPPRPSVRPRRRWFVR
jgi:protein-tyrosine phosphatase